MDDFRWMEVDGVTSHAFRIGRTRSACGHIHLPIGFRATTDEKTPRCKACHRAVMNRLTKQWAATADPVIAWRDRATLAVMGDGWTYAEVEDMPSWKESVDRVAIKLAEAFREGMLQGSAASRTEGS